MTKPTEGPSSHVAEALADTCRPGLQFLRCSTGREGITVNAVMAAATYGAGYFTERNDDDPQRALVQNASPLGSRTGTVDDAADAVEFFTGKLARWNQRNAASRQRRRGLTRRHTHRLRIGRHPGPLCRRRRGVIAGTSLRPKRFHCGGGPHPADRPQRNRPGLWWFATTGEPPVAHWRRRPRGHRRHPPGRARRHLDPGPAAADAPARPRHLAAGPGQRARRQPSPAWRRSRPRRRRDRDLPRCRLAHCTQPPGVGREPVCGQVLRPKSGAAGWQLTHGHAQRHGPQPDRWHNHSARRGARG